MASTTNERLLTVAEAAQRLNCSTKTTRRMIASGELDSVRIGPARRLVRVPETALRVYLARRHG